MAAIQTSLPLPLNTKRKDNLYYDGHNELSRETVIGVWNAIKHGGIYCAAKIGDETGSADNTIVKALNILRFHGYVSKVGMRRNVTNDGNVALYCAIR